MKKLASLDGTLFTKEQTIALKLHEQPYIILIPKSILTNHGIHAENIEFNLVILDKKIALLGPEVPDPRAIQSSAKRIVN